MNSNQPNGYGIIEILVASTIGVILFLSVNGFLTLSLKMAIDDMHKVEAMNLVRATLEEARAARDEDQSTPTVDPKLGWNNIYALTRDTAYYFAQSGTGPYTWGSVSGAQTVGRYTVWFTVSDVTRASDGDIVTGGTLDPGTVKITSYVNWTSSRGAEEISLYEYLTDIK
ncbi:MAG: hypothetical protein WC788_04120 [Candidatus Paceibacterota bacterium]|jgi:hypothetical protein